MNETNGGEGVDFIINTFERTYRTVLAPGYVKSLAESHRYAFESIIVLINNVNDQDAVRALAQCLVDAGEITRFAFVADLLPTALKQAGLSTADLMPDIHYTDCALAAVWCSNAAWMVYSDADVVLAEPYDWISPGRQLMAADSRVGVVNPGWVEKTTSGEFRERKDGFKLSYGFSDQLYLIRREEFRRPIYQHTALISLRYPLAARGRVFEQMVDSYMRVHGRMRATSEACVYKHVAEEGATYPRFEGMAKWRQIRNKVILKILRKMGSEDPRLSV